MSSAKDLLQEVIGATSAGNGKAAEVETLPGSALLVTGETTVEYGLVAAWRSLHPFGNFGSKELTWAWRGEWHSKRTRRWDSLERRC